MTSAQSPVILDEVWKSYGANPAVRGLSFDVPAQSVYGFLGPNGAGKSTTIRMMLGLQRPDRGSILLFGQPLESQRTAALARIGSLVETPSLYQHLTGRENLELHRRLINAPRNAVVRALDTVGLKSAADRVVRGYSSGMKQRLGLAQALLGEPELLLLDEPTNGLDPAGIHEIRSLIQALPGQHGVTVFLSSHLLAEVEQVATHLAIISEGQVRFQGSVADLRYLNEPTIEAEVDPAEDAFRLLTSAGMRVEVGERRLRIASQPGYEPADINAMLVRAGIRVSEFISRRPTLEEVFLNLTDSRRVEEEVFAR